LIGPTAKLAENPHVAHAQISQIACHFPENVLGNEELAELYSGWTPQSIEEKLGVRIRPIAAEDETSADLAVRAGENLFARGDCSPKDIDFLIFCTQEPDYLLPSSACLIQDRLGIPKTAGAFDYNLGCSGFVYGLAMARGLIETEMARNVLLLTANTYSKLINRLDRVTRPLFGDAAAATLIRGVDSLASEGPAIGPFIFGTDGSKGDVMIVPAGGRRLPCSPSTAIEQTDANGAVRSKDQICMNGQGIFSFAMDAVPRLVEDLMQKAQVTRDDVDLFVFHQANKFMLEALRHECDIDPERFVVELAERGNTVSSTIPIALLDSQNAGRLKPNARVMLIGFGVGLSWAGTMAVMPESV
jgi:3-oxoacyl-[acyl-carrier-protein] synthase-3